MIGIEGESPKVPNQHQLLDFWEAFDNVARLHATGDLAEWDVQGPGDAERLPARILGYGGVVRRAQPSPRARQAQDGRCAAFRGGRRRISSGFSRESPQRFRNTRAAFLSRRGPSSTSRSPPPPPQGSDSEGFDGIRSPPRRDFRSAIRSRVDHATSAPGPEQEHLATTFRIAARSLSPSSDTSLVDLLSKELDIAEPEDSLPKARPSSPSTAGPARCPLLDFREPPGDALSSEMRAAVLSVALQKSPGHLRTAMLPICNEGPYHVRTAMLPLSSDWEPDAQSLPVLLHIYDVSRETSVQRLNCFLANRHFPVKLGGVFHAGVEVNGLEWSFGLSNSATTPGVSCVEPQAHPDHNFRQTVRLPHTKLSAESVAEILSQLVEEYPGNDYDVLRRNCCHFADDFCQRLGVGPIPAWVHRLARLGAHIDGVLCVSQGLQARRLSRLNSDASRCASSQDGTPQRCSSLDRLRVRKHRHAGVSTCECEYQLSSI